MFDLELSRMKWRRSSLPTTAPDTSQVGLWNIMRKSIGKDLSRIAMPVILNEPLSVLQKLCEEMEYSDLLDRASQTDDVHLRLVYVVAFIVSTYSSNYYRAGRKNFNPLLGETYECIREDKGWKFIAEQVMPLKCSIHSSHRLSGPQVSHHPPISVCSCESANFTFIQSKYSYFCCSDAFIIAFL
jgi:oxysterol-binding protein-related protein 3/6/7